MDFPKPSTYVPLARRFTNERERELRETKELYAWVKQYDPDPMEVMECIGKHIYPYIKELPKPLLDQFIYTLFDILKSEPYLKELPPPTLERMNLQEFVEYRNLLHAKQYFITNRETLTDLIQEGIERIFVGLTEYMPLTEYPSPFVIPLASTLPEAPLHIDKIYGTLMESKYANRGLFTKIGDTLYRNLCTVSDKEPGVNSSRPFKNADNSNLPLNEMLDVYLSGTPFHELFNIPVPLRLTYEERFNHMHVVGGTGSGKTTLIENLIRHDLASDDPPSLIIIDPHSDLVRKLARSDLGIEDRLIIIDPRDTEYPPALNIFAMNRERLGTYDEATREQVTAGAIQTFEYLFSGLFSSDLTGKQSVFFKYVARLMLSLPETMGRNATILDMMRLMSDPTPYSQAIEELPEIPREFFQRDFMSKTFVQTKEQIRYRLQAIIENPTLARLFTSPETKIDIFTALNNGSVILVDTAKDFLKGGSGTFGRIIISLVLQAVLERAAIPEKDRKPCFLIVDEAASYFDSNIDDLLTDARKFKCGCLFSHQYLDQASSSLRASLAANTGIKFASGLSAGDARSMTPEMRTTSDFILNQPRLQFACHIRNVTPHAVSIPIRPITQQRMLSREAYERIIKRNHERVSLPPAPREQKPLEKPSLQEPDEDISYKW